MNREVLGSGIEAHTSGHSRKMGALPVTPVFLEVALFLWLPGFSAVCLHDTTLLMGRACGTSGLDVGVILFLVSSSFPSVN